MRLLQKKKYLPTYVRLPLATNDVIYTGIRYRKVRKSGGGGIGTQDKQNHIRRWITFGFAPPRPLQT